MSKNRITSSERLKKIYNFTKELPPISFNKERKSLLFSETDLFSLTSSKFEENFDSDVSLHLDEFFKRFEKIKIQNANIDNKNEPTNETKSLKIKKLRKKRQRTSKKEKKVSELIDYQMEPFNPVLIRKFKSYLPAQEKKARIAAPSYLKQQKIEGEYTRTISKIKIL